MFFFYYRVLCPKCKSAFRVQYGHLEIFSLNLQVFFNGLGPQVLQHVHDMGKGVTISGALGAGEGVVISGVLRAGVRVKLYVQPAKPKWLVDQVVRVGGQVKHL